MKITKNVWPSKYANLPYFFTKSGIMFPWVSFFLLISNQSVPPSDMKYNSLNNADLNQGGKELKRADIAALYLPIKSIYSRFPSPWLFGVSLHRSTSLDNNIDKKKLVHISKTPNDLKHSITLYMTVTISWYSFSH